MMIKNFLSISKQDLKNRGYKGLDILLITGDAYVDHPSYGVAVIGRLLESVGYKVGVIAQPDYRTSRDFLELGSPRLFFGITSGNTDSMIANYTANKKPRETDDYSPAGKTGMRPDRALIVYANKIREIFGSYAPIVIGGIEASLRRLAHYDYWDNCVRRSILLDSRANILVYGMGEKQILEIAQRLNKGEKINSLDNIRGSIVVREDTSFLKEFSAIASFEEVKDNKEKFNLAFKEIYRQMNPWTAKPVVQKHYNRYVIQFPPALPLTTKELDNIYELPYTRNYHPVYNKQGGVKGIETVRFSIISHRGCCGECSFCSLYFHQGRIVQSRSPESLLKEAQLICKNKAFHGTITDIGGPTANLYTATCPLWNQKGFCENKHCLLPTKCKNLRLGYRQSLDVYKKVRGLPEVKHLFIGSGFRYDLLTENYADDYLKELCKYHISGQMKVAPEHIVDKVLKIMNKPSQKVYEKFVHKFLEINRQLGKTQFLVNYFISSHPGSTLQDALKLALYLRQRRIHPEQIQDFIPSPMTVSGCIYYTEKHPFRKETIYVPRGFGERKMQRALIQHKNPKNKKLLFKALKQINCLHLLKKFCH